jgi:hypothetical protein
MRAPAARFFFIMFRPTWKIIGAVGEVAFIFRTPTSLKEVSDAITFRLQKYGQHSAMLQERDGHASTGKTARFLGQIPNSIQYFSKQIP